MERELGGGEEKVLELIKKAVSVALKHRHHIRELCVVIIMKMRMRKVRVVMMVIKIIMMMRTLTLSGTYRRVTH